MVRRLARCFTTRQLSVPTESTPELLASVAEGVPELEELEQPWRAAPVTTKTSEPRTSLDIMVVFPRTPPE